MAIKFTIGNDDDVSLFFPKKSANQKKTVGVVLADFANAVEKYQKKEKTRKVKMIYDGSTLAIDFVYGMEHVMIKVIAKNEAESKSFIKDIVSQLRDNSMGSDFNTKIQNAIDKEATRMAERRAMKSAK